MGHWDLQCSVFFFVLHLFFSAQWLTRVSYVYERATWWQWSGYESDIKIWESVVKAWVPYQCKDHISLFGISIIKIIRSWDRLIFIMGIHVLIKQRRYIETVPWHLRKNWVNKILGTCFMAQKPNYFTSPQQITSCRGEMRIRCRSLRASESPRRDNKLPLRDT